MKKTTRNKETKAFTEAVGRALRRAAKVARKTAKMYGTPIYFFGKRQDGGEETMILAKLTPIKSSSHLLRVL